jgi:hypothetical protein
MYMMPTLTVVAKNDSRTPFLLAFVALTSLKPNDSAQAAGSRASNMRERHNPALACSASCQATLLFPIGLCLVCKVGSLVYAWSHPKLGRNFCNHGVLRNNTKTTVINHQNDILNLLS